MAAALAGPPPLPALAAAEFVVREAGPGDAAVLAGLGRHRALFYLCFGSDAFAPCARTPCPQDEVAVVAAGARSGQVVGHGRVVPAEGDPEAGELTVAALPEYRRLGVAAAIAGYLAEAARAHGYRRLFTCVPREQGDPFAGLREAGLWTVSCFGTGGVNEVVLSLYPLGEAEPEPTPAEVPPRGSVHVRRRDVR